MIIGVMNHNAPRLFPLRELVSLSDRIRPRRRSVALERQSAVPLGVLQIPLKTANRRNRSERSGDVD